MPSTSPLRSCARIPVRSVTGWLAPRATPDPGLKLADPRHDLSAVDRDPERRRHRHRVVDHHVPDPKLGSREVAYVGRDDHAARHRLLGEHAPRSLHASGARQRGLIAGGGGDVGCDAQAEAAARRPEDGPLDAQSQVAERTGLEAPGGLRCPVGRGALLVQYEGQIEEQLGVSEQAEGRRHVGRGAPADLGRRASGRWGPDPERRRPAHRSSGRRPTASTWAAPDWSRSPRDR